MTTRRDKARAATIEEIKQAALSQIAAEGTTALSIRGIARAIGMSPAGLYRYYEGLDALLTDLITDAYSDLAGTVEAAIADTSGGSGDRFTAGVMAYRGWAVRQPNRFLLIFGTPIPGYAAPEGGPTVEANRRLGQAFFMVAAEGWNEGEIQKPRVERPITDSERDLAADIGAVAEGFPNELVPVLLGTWAHFHGLVTLEILEQLHWMYPDPREFFAGEVRRMVKALVR